MEQLTQLALDATEQTGRSDAAGRGMRGRLQVLMRYASGLGPIAEQMDAAVDRYVSALRSVSDGTLAIISRMKEDPDELAAGLEFGMIVRRLAAVTRDSMASSSAMVESIRENADLSRVIREPSRRLTAALERFAEATSTIDDWDRRLQSIGIPMPPDDWEPHVEETPMPNEIHGLAVEGEADRDESHEGGREGSSP